VETAVEGITGGSFGKRVILLAVASLIATMLPFVLGIPDAAAADVVLPPILLAGHDAEDDGNGNGNPGSRVDTWSYQIKNPNPFDLTATIEANTGQFNEGDVGPPSGTWVQTQVVSVLVPANSQTQIARRQAKPPALGTTMDGSSYGFRAVWDDYPTVGSNYVGLSWPVLLTIPSSLGAPFTDPGPPFVGTGGVIHGFIDNRGPDFVGAFSCDFDASGGPTGNYTYHWWVNNSAFTGNPELINVELARSNGAMFNGAGFSRQSVSWNDTRSGADAINADGIQVGGWHEARGWFRPKINNPNPGGTAADNTWPWDGSTPPGSVWSLNSTPYNKHTTSLVQADDCATKYADLPVYGGDGPTVTITAPTAGAGVAGVVTVEVDATDDDPAGSLTVEVSTDGGAGWANATWNAGTGRYEFVWDTRTVPDGPATFDARATDSDTNTGNATQVNVTVGNQPTASIVAPTAGATVNGAVTIEVDAADSDPSGTLDVEVSTNGGATGSPAPWNGATSRYEYDWDTTPLPDGPATIDARATDSDLNVANAAQVNVTVQNTPIPPTVAIAAPLEGASFGATVTVEVDATDDDPVGTLAVAVSTNGGATWSPAPWNGATSRYEYDWDTTPLPDGPATIDARATDSDTNTTNAATVNVSVHNGPDQTLLVTAADIGRCDLTSDNDTGALLDAIFAIESGEIAIPGDIAYPSGSTADFVCFDDAWGQHKALMNPVPGNHEYFTTGAAGYFAYFGAAAGDPSEGYYSWTIDDNWIGIALNSNCAQVSGGCAAGGAQEQWLRGVLAANLDMNVVAMFHHPRWATNNYSNNANMQPFWQALYDYGAEMVLVGHEHHYERYQPLDDTGAPDPSFGVREFIVGMGGTTLRPQVNPPSPFSEEQQYAHHGVLKLYLEADSYSWDFVAVGGGYTDSGTESTHGAPNMAPVVAISQPTEGAVVSGTTTLEVMATDADPPGSLDVEVSTDGGGSWQTAAWNAAGAYYEYSWDTTATADGPATIDARATDSDSNTTNATTVNVTIGNAPPGDYRSAVIVDGANVFWRLADPAGTIASDGISANDATYLGNPGLGAPGLIGGGNAAVDFDGIDDTIHQDNSIQVNQGGPYTTKSIELWFNVTGTSSRQTLYEQGSASRGLNIYIDGGRLYAGAYNISSNGGDTPWGPVFISTPITAGVPHHVVLTFDQPSDSLRLYVDGALAASGSGIGTLHNHGRSAIGSQWTWARYHTGGQSGDVNFVDGVIDEVAHYPSVLDSAAVAIHYALGSGGSVLPTAQITSPNNGAFVSGAVTIQVNSTDDDPSGTLDVEVSTNGGATWSPAAWNGGTSRYEASWDTTTLPDGPTTIDARATDSDTNTTNATSVNVTVSNSGSGYRDLVLGDGAWVYWHLGEAAGTTMVDELGDNDQTYSGSPTLGQPGLIDDPDTAVSFDGTDDRVALINSVEINREDPATTKTVEFWFSAGNVSNRQVILEQGSITRGMNVYLFGGRLYAGVYNTSSNGGDTPWGPVFLSGAVSTNTTYHVAVVFNQPADSLQLYLNGTLADSSGNIGQLYPHSVSSIAAPRNWARYHDGAQNGGNYFFAGTLDEFAIYPTALAPTAIAGHYLAGIG